MLDQIEIRSNILGDIMKIRKGVVFKDRATVVDELFQNCSRAKATEIRFSIEDDLMVIEDNGVGCEDPQAVFEKNTSAWGNEDEAFGEGFFSVFLLADHLTVRSCDWRLEIDVLKMLETGNLKIDVTRVPQDMYLKGFRVEIKGERIREDKYTLLHEARMLGRIAEAMVYVDDFPVEKQPLLELDDAEFAWRVSNDLYEAVLSPAVGFPGVHVYYDNRPVKQHWVSYVRGKVHIRKGKITLKAPDRKEYIYDEKLAAFEEQLRKDIAEMYREFVRTADDRSLDRFADGISTYLDVDDYLDLLTIDESFFDFLRYMEQDEEVMEQQEASDRDQVKKAADAFRTLVEDIMEDREVVDEEEIDPDVPSGGPRLMEVIARDKRLAWVRPSEVDSLKNRIREAEYFGFWVIVAKNKLYERAFEHLGVLHIEALQENVQKMYEKEKEGPRSKKEERLLALLRRVTRHYGLPDDTIQIADLDLKLLYTMNQHVVEVESKRVNGLCEPENKKIYIDRKLVDWLEYRAQAPDYPNVTVHDYRVLMQVMETVAHELAHLLFRTEDNTLAHHEAQSMIYREIVRLF